MDEDAVKLQILQSARLTGGEVQSPCTPRLYLIHSNLIHSNLIHSNLIHSNLIHSDLIHSNLIQSNLIQSGAHYFLQLFTLPIIKNITPATSSPKTLLKNPRR